MKINKLLIAEFLESHKDSKFTNITASLVINFKMKSANMKFVQNFLHYLPHAVRPFSKHILIYSKNESSQMFDKQTHNGVDYDISRVERSSHQALANFDLGKNSATKAHAGVLNRNSILPNNMSDYYSVDLEALSRDVRSGTAVKMHQMNNTINIVVGTIHSSPIQIAENLVSVIKALLHKGQLISCGYLCLPMNKSIKIS